MTDLTPDKLNQIEKAATRRQVVHTYVNGEPDGMTNAVLALAARVRDLEAIIANVRGVRSDLDFTDTNEPVGRTILADMRRRLDDALEEEG